MTETSETIHDFLLSTVDSSNSSKYSHTQIREYVKFQIILLDQKIVSSDLIAKSLKQWYIFNKSLMNLNLLNDLINKQTDLMLLCNITYILLSNVSQYTFKKLGLANINIDFEYIISYPETLNSNIIAINHIIKQNKVNNRSKIVDCSNSYLYDILTDMTNTFLYSSIIQFLILSFGTFNIKRREEYNNNKKRINEETERLNEPIGPIGLLKELEEGLASFESKNELNGNTEDDNNYVISDIHELLNEDVNNNADDGLLKETLDSTELLEQEKSDIVLSNIQKATDTKNNDMILDKNDGNVISEQVTVDETVIDNYPNIEINNNEKNISLTVLEKAEDIPNNIDNVDVKKTNIDRNNFISGSFIDRSIYESASTSLYK